MVRNSTQVGIVVTALGCLVGFGGVPAARAETYAPQCDVSFWTPTQRDDEATLRAVPVQPWILVPTVWASTTYGSPSDADLPPTEAFATDVLAITVRDGAGQEIPGETAPWPAGVAVPLGVPLLAHQPRWRPTAALTPGATYVMTVAITVPEGIGDPYSPSCDFQDFTRTLRLEVEPVPADEPKLDVGIRTFDTWPTDHRYGDCSRLPDGTACPGAPDICCDWLSLKPDRTVAVTVVFDPPPAGHESYVQLVVSADPPGSAPSFTIAPLPPSGVANASKTTKVAADAPPPEVRCVTVRRFDVFAGDYVSTRRTCTDPTLHEAAPERPALVCDTLTCMRLATAEGEPDPSTPDVIGATDASPPNDASPASDATADATDDDANLDAGALGPAGPRDASGCTGGESPSTALWLGLLGGLAAAHARRRLIRERAALHCNTARR